MHPSNTYTTNRQSEPWRKDIAPTADNFEKTVAAGLESSRYGTTSGISAENPFGTPLFMQNDEMPTMKPVEEAIIPFFEPEKIIRKLQVACVNQVLRIKSARVNKVLRTDIAGEGSDKKMRQSSTAVATKLYWSILYPPNQQITSKMNKPNDFEASGNGEGIGLRLDGRRTLAGRGATAPMAGGEGSDGWTIVKAV
ncbi:hypothetical protein QVD17_30998 [Tagetes erecta]|uniref:Uncharacterized protein n=1 Tax=Tagetes erecta TaxID=13708 RepID=A0AAD8K2K8_TARER|nr:hypothetical protein QVD17_30998 [Tagetes erecta]